MNSLNNENRKKTVLITGAGQGIGQAIAFRFAAEGSNIVIASKDNPIQVTETANGISKAGGQVLACDIDVRDYNDGGRACVTCLTFIHLAKKNQPFSQKLTQVTQARPLSLLNLMDMQCAFSLITGSIYPKIGN